MESDAPSTRESGCAAGPVPFARRGVIALAAVLLAGTLSIAALAVPAPASSPVATAEVGPRWADLSPTQRSHLAPIEREWPRMDERNKQKWLGVSVRLSNVGPAERERIQARMTEWASLTPAERAQMRLRYQETRQVAPKSRQDRWAAYQALPPEERQRLAARALHPPHAASGVGAERGRQRWGSVTRKPISPTLVQAQPGATTMLISRRSAPPLHFRPGMPRIMAPPELVDSVTLLPKRVAASAPMPLAAGTRAVHD